MDDKAQQSTPHIKDPTIADNAVFHVRGEAPTAIKKLIIATLIPIDICQLDHPAASEVSSWPLLVIEQIAPAIPIAPAIRYGKDARTCSRRFRRTKKSLFLISIDRL
ncbi:hypothetical protein [Sphingomonas sp. CLY1604]|uniref:hypothetical protein n=1 Tax=Sphingomonas sp. CLY1604 TaxID=3457786 RepID=UPI003FD79256